MLSNAVSAAGKVFVWWRGWGGVWRRAGLATISLPPLGLPSTGPNGVFRNCAAVDAESLGAQVFAAATGDSSSSDTAGITCNLTIETDAGRTTNRSLGCHSGQLAPGGPQLLFCRDETCKAEDSATAACMVAGVPLDVWCDCHAEDGEFVCSGEDGSAGALTDDLMLQGVRRQLQRHGIPLE